MHQLTLNKILFIGVFNINHSHTVKDILKIIKIMNKILFRLSKQLDNLNSLTPAKIPRPLFQVRK